MLCLCAWRVTLDHARCAGGAGSAALSPPFSTANRCSSLRARQRGANPAAFLLGSAPPAPSSRGPIWGCACPSAGRAAGSARTEPARLDPAVPVLPAAGLGSALGGAAEFALARGRAAGERGREGCGDPPRVRPPPLDP